MSIYKIRYGSPEEVTPRTFAPAALTMAEEIPPEKMEDIEFRESVHGSCLTVKMPDDANYYGFGLQQRGFNQRGNRLQIKTNADTRCNNGNSHAPVPFVITDKGFGIYVDSARYVTFYCGKEKKIKKTDTLKTEVALSESALYGDKKTQGDKYLIIGPTNQ